MTQFYDKTLLPTEMSKGQIDITKYATTKFDYTAIANRFKIVSWSNYIHPAGVINRFIGPTFPLSATAV